MAHERNSKDKESPTAITLTWLASKYKAHPQTKLQTVLPTGIRERCTSFHYNVEGGRGGGDRDRERDRERETVTERQREIL